MALILTSGSTTAAKGHGVTLALGRAVWTCLTPPVDERILPLGASAPLVNLASKETLHEHR
jgi:hypothetical protein